MTSDYRELMERAQAFVDRKYVARADARQKEMGLAYVEAERQDLAKEIAKFTASAIEALLAEREADQAELKAHRDSLLLKVARMERKMAEARAEAAEACVSELDAAWQEARKTLPPDPSLNAPWSPAIAIMENTRAALVKEGKHNE